MTGERSEIEAAVLCVMAPVPPDVKRSLSTIIARLSTRGVNVSREEVTRVLRQLEKEGRVKGTTLWQRVAQKTPA